MFSRTARVSVEKFNQVLEKGRVVHSPFFVLRFISNDVGPKARLAAIAPQKTFRTAVSRNRTRRRIYEAVKPFYEQLPQHCTLLVFAKNPAGTASFVDLKKALKELFVKAGLMR